MRVRLGLGPAGIRAALRLLAMSQRGVEIALGKLATDEALRSRFRHDPAVALRELAAAGIELNAVERAALESMSPAALQRFARALDARLQRAALGIRRSPLRGSVSPEAREETVMPTSPHRIDVHHHILPPEYVKACAKAGITDSGGIALPLWNEKAALDLMDRAGIATAITSIAAPGVHFGDRAAAQDLARWCNERSARLVSDHPRRFGAFATLPMPDVDVTLKEMEYALDVLRLDGVVLLASIGERYLGDPAFDAVFAELNRRKAVLFVHPTVPVTSHALTMRLPGALIEFVFDTTRAVTNLIYSGTLERYQDISIILSHAGGTVPFLAGRLTLGTLIPALRDKAPQGAIAYLKRLYYDTALSATPYAMSALRELVEPSHILFGSDYPFLPDSGVLESTRGLSDYNGFDAPTRMRIERDNALALFPRLRAV